MSAGEDLLIEFGNVAKAVIDACIERKLARPGHIVTSGTSRGGLGALHILASDDRVSGVAMLAPVTHLPALTEFKAIESSPIVQHSSAAALVDKVAGRAVCITMNTNDTRVSSERCLQFYSLLRSKYPSSRLGLWTHIADGHGMPDPGYQYGAGFLLTLCSDTARASDSK
jgi:hypothetical protein